MAIVKNMFKVARSRPENQSLHTIDAHMSSDNEEFQRRNSISAVETDDEDDDDFDDCDSGAGSDDFDLLELGETGEEFCQVGDETCSIPYELYDLPGLKDVLSMEAWNELLTEGERFGLASDLPDMDQVDFICTLKELFAGDNLHFGSPVDKLFEMLKGGLCEPRVALYRQGLNFFRRRQHYHNLKKHQNTLVNNLCHIKDAWLNCRCYSIDEKLRVLNIMKSQRSLMNENVEELGGESSDSEESEVDLWGTEVKVQKLGQKAGRYSGYNMGLTSRGRKTTTEPAKRGKQKSKGTWNLDGQEATSVNELSDHFPPSDHRVKMKLGRYGSGFPVSGFGAAGYKSSASVKMNAQIADEEEEATMYEVAVHKDQNFRQVAANSKPGASRIWKKHQGIRADKNIDSFTGIPISARNDLHSLGWRRPINQLSDIKVLTAKPSNARNIYDGGKRVKYAENLQQFNAENQMKLGKAQNSNSTFKGSQVELSGGSDSAWLSKQHGRLFPFNLSPNPSDLNARNKRWKMDKEVVELQENDKLLHAEYRAKSLNDKFQASSLQNERIDGVGNQGPRTFSKSEEMESSSSGQMDEDDNDNFLMRSKWAYPSKEPDLKYGRRTKKAKLSARDKKDSHLTIIGSSESAREIEGYSKDLEMMKAERKGKMNDTGYFNVLPTNGLDKNNFPGPEYISGSDDRRQPNRLACNNVEGNYGCSFHIPSMKSSLMEERRVKDEICSGFGVHLSSCMHDYKFHDSWFWMRQVGADTGIPFKLHTKGHKVELPSEHHPERSDIPLMGCSNLPKKQKMKHDLTYVDLQDTNDHLHVDGQLQVDDMSSKRKLEKNKLKDVPDSLGQAMLEPPITEMEMEDVEAEPKPKKKPFPLIIPTIFSGFSFSIIHLLSAVRMAMITLLPDDSSEARKHIGKNDAGQGVKERDRMQESTVVVNSSSNMDVNTSGPSAQAIVPSLSVQDIVNRVRSNPGDPCILETQEPLQDLVRGVLQIFSSRSAPLGAKGWIPLVVHEKSSKSWSWTGPLSHNLSDSEAVEGVTSADSWGLPHKMLVKLVDSYSNWLKNSQDALQQIGSLPSPPSKLMQINLDEKERFKDMRAQKSLSTISPSSEEVKAYFRKEEFLRYLLPDRAFSYTAVDGKKSIVAPLRRCGGKPTSKARDHFMLKLNRPPHVTILCLVRDAAARLPGSIGTRADVCTLIRDSQYVVENVSDAQVNQVVSGALDRLHYERDPCVQFDGERKLWMYLHSEREEEDFEDDGTSSTKKWRRQKKEATEQSDQGEVPDAYTGPVGQSEFDLASVEISCIDNDKRSEPDYNDANCWVDSNNETSHGSDQGVHHNSVWNGVGLNTMEENKFICQENSNNEDFSGEPPI